jgi:hypothetical protein
MLRRNTELILLNRWVLVAGMVLLSLVSVAYGDGELKISASTGDAGGCSSYTGFFGAEIGDQIHEITALSDSCLSQSFEGSGNKAKRFSVTNKAGDHAEVGFAIKNSKRYSGSYELSPKKADYAMASEELDVVDAESILAFSKAISRDGLASGTAIDIEKGSLLGFTNSAYATLGRADSRQEIGRANGEDIELYAKTSDELFRNMAESSVKVDEGHLINYRSEAEAVLLEDGPIDFYAVHGPFCFDIGVRHPVGSISGDKISSEGSTFNQEGFAARYGVTINHGSIKGRFDWATETWNDGWVIAVPLESPEVWGGIPGDIKVSALGISSYSEASYKGKIVSKDSASAKRVSTNNWVQGAGFAEGSEAGNP